MTWTVEQQFHRCTPALPVLYHENNLVPLTTMLSFDLGKTEEKRHRNWNLAPSASVFV